MEGIRNSCRSATAGISPQYFIDFTKDCPECKEDVLTLDPNSTVFKNDTEVTIQHDFTSAVETSLLWSDSVVKSKLRLSDWYCGGLEWSLKGADKRLATFEDETDTKSLNLTASEASQIGEYTLEVRVEYASYSVIAKKEFKIEVIGQENQFTVEVEPEIECILPMIKVCEKIEETEDNES